MILKMNVLLKTKERAESEVRRYMTADGYEKYKEEINKSKISSIRNKK